MSLLTTDIESLFYAGIRTVLIDYPQQPAQFKSVFKLLKSDKLQEITAQETYKTVFTGITMAATIGISKEAEKLMLYPTAFPADAKFMRQCLFNAKQINTARPFNDAFNSRALLADGQPLASDRHPVVGGDYFANSFGDNVYTDMAEGTIEQMVILAKKLKAPNGVPMDAKVRLMSHNVDQDFEATRILKSTTRTGTANRDINALYSLGSVPEGHESNIYYTTNNFFLHTNVDGPKLFQNWEPEMDNIPADTTLMRQAVVSERYMIGIDDPRSAICARYL